MKRRLIAVALLLVIGAVTFFVLRAPDADAALEASGTVEATEADLGFNIPGRVQSIHVREGDLVAAGQELARLDAAEIDARLGAAHAQAAAARAQLAELEAGARTEEVVKGEAGARAAEERLEDAARDLERARRLFEGGAISQEARQKAETAYAVAGAAAEHARQQVRIVRTGPRPERIRAQRALVAQADAAVAQVEAQLAHAVIRAPFAGRVTIRHREPGETVQPGQPVITLMNPAGRWVQIYVAEDRIGRVSIGQRALITADSYPGKEYDGRVTFVAREAEFTPRNVQTEEERVKLVYAVRVEVLGDPEFELKPGVPADVRLLGEEVRDRGEE